MARAMLLTSPVQIAIGLLTHPTASEFSRYKSVTPVYSCFRIDIDMMIYTMFMLFYLKNSYVSA
jgi:hypothetical protein